MPSSRVRKRKPIKKLAPTGAGEFCMFPSQPSKGAFQPGPNDACSMLRSLSRPLSNGQTTSNDIAGSDSDRGRRRHQTQAVVRVSAMSQRVSGYPRQSDDVYETPAWVTWAVSPYLHEYCRYLRALANGPSSKMMQTLRRCRFECVATNDDFVAQYLCRTRRRWLLHQPASQYRWSVRVPIHRSRA